MNTRSDAHSVECPECKALPGVPCCGRRYADPVSCHKERHRAADREKKGRLDQAIALLRQARRLNNQTIRDSREMAAWHKAMDDLLSRFPNDDAGERYDDPQRVDHRKFVERMFR